MFGIHKVIHFSTIGNTVEEKAEIKQFVKDMFVKKENGTIAFPPSVNNNDGQTIGYV